MLQARMLAHLNLLGRSLSQVKCPRLMWHSLHPSVSKADSSQQPSHQEGGRVPDAAISFSGSQDFALLSPPLNLQLGQGLFSCSLGQDLYFISYCLITYVPLKLQFSIRTLFTHFGQGTFLQYPFSNLPLLRYLDTPSILVP